MKITFFNNTSTGILSNKILVSTCILAAFFILAISFSRIIYLYDVGVYESGIWAPAELVINGINPYSENIATAEPYIMSPYGIAYYLLVGLGLKLFGVQFWFARMISFLCVVLCAFLIKAILNQITQNSKIALLGVVIFLAQYPVQYCTGLQRADNLVFSLSLIGILMALKTKEYSLKNFGSIILQAIVFSVSFLFRQNSILPVCGVGLWYLLNKRYTYLFTFCFFYFLIVLTSLYCLNKTSLGGFFWQQFEIVSKLDKSSKQILNMFFSYVTAPSVFIIIILFLWQILLIKKNSISNIKQPLIFTLFFVYLSVALLMTLYMSSVEGSGINYYLEVAIPSSIFIPLCCYQNYDKIKKSKFYILLLVFVGFGLSIRGIQICRGEYFRWQSKPYYDEIVSVIKEKTSPKEPSHSVYSELVLLANRTAYFNDFVQYGSRSPKLNNIYNDNIKARKMAAIVTHLKDTIPGYYLYKTTNQVPVKFYPVYLFLRK